MGGGGELWGQWAICVCWKEGALVLYEGQASFALKDESRGARGRECRGYSRLAVTNKSADTVLLWHGFAADVIGALAACPFATHSIINYSRPFTMHTAHVTGCWQAE